MVLGSLASASKVLCLAPDLEGKKPSKENRSVGKPATLSTGAVVRVPLFVQTGEVIRVDTRNGEYVGRAQK